MEDYGRRVVVDRPFDRAVVDVVQALQHDFRRYVLLQAATPRVTLEALQDDLAVGAILPITVAVYELADGETAVVVSEPFAAVISEPGWRETAPHLARLADQESAQLARAVDRFQREAQPA